MVHPYRKRKRAISPVRNTGRLRNHPKYEQIQNKYREILLRGNLDNEPYEGITTNNIAKIIDRELFYGAKTVARTNSMKTDFENMMRKENINHAKKLRKKVYNSRTGIRKLFTPIGTSLLIGYQAAEEAKLKRALNGSSRPRPWWIR
jgi:ribosomal protein L21